MCVAVIPERGGAHLSSTLVRVPVEAVSPSERGPQPPSALAFLRVRKWVLGLAVGGSAGIRIRKFIGGGGRASWRPQTRRFTPWAGVPGVGGIR